MDRTEAESRLKNLLGLPVEKRAAAERDFLACVWVLLPSFEAYMKRLAAPHVRPYEVEDVAATVIGIAAESLREQFLHPEKKHSDGWRYHDQGFDGWFRFFCGWPFKGARSGKITKVIRGVWRASRHESLDIDGEADKLVNDDELSPEQVVIEAQKEQAQTEDLHCMKQALKEMERTNPRRAFMIKLDFGVHSFKQLDSDALVSMARDLRLSREQIALVKSVAGGLKFRVPQITLSQIEIARLTGVSDSTVRSELRKGKKNLMMAVRESSQASCMA